ncbi:MAG: WHG domain-containing protein [Clostridia bacterium]|nr:WHG domain-containing protein [Clostridia bacterium]
MPPAARHSREDILEAAFGILRAEGPSALTARHLGEVLGGSSRPIFTLFRSMQEVQTGAMERAKDLYSSYLDRGLRADPPFKGAGMEHIRFAADEPRLFQEIFMSPANAGWGGSRLFLQSEANYARILHSLTGYYALPPDAAGRLYEHLWIYAHGLASLIATGVMPADMDRISRQLTEVFSSLLPHCQKGELL